MPSIGEVKRGREIGRPGIEYKFTWVACPRCKKERWVRSSKFKKGQAHCHPCAAKIDGESKRKPCSHPIEAHPQWEGGRKVTPKGYIKVSIGPDSPYFSMVSPSNRFASNGGYVFEHRLIMAQKLGRCLQPTEKVHHKNGIKSENRPRNLRVKVKDHHTSYEAGYREGYQDASELKNDELEKQIRLLRWELKQSRGANQLRFGWEDTNDQER